MALDSAQEIQQYLVLQQKTDADLRTLCEAQEMDPIGSRDELIQRLLSLSVTPQTDVFAPQLIALRTKYQGKDIPGAGEFMQKMRKIIYEGKGNYQEFSILNGKNEPYMFGMRYAKCSEETRQYIFGSNIVYPHQSQKELVQAILKTPEQYEYHIVNRLYGKNKSFVMLHVKRAA